MDGDRCPVEELVFLCEKYNARLIIDEAHATGVIGEKGEGVIQMEGLEAKVFARLHTFGKACGVHGAAVLGSMKLKEYLLNFARPLIYSTALPGQTVAHIKASYEMFPGMQAERSQIGRLIRYFREQIQHMEFSIPGVRVLGSETAIQGVIIPGNEEVRRIANILQQNNLDIRPIMYPSVPWGEERLRIVLHAFNTIGELDLLLNSLKNSL
jgi:8-amino-7-oxononanoate synthase